MSLAPIAESKEHLLDLVQHCNGTVIGMVTPELAAALLTLNTGNRPLTTRGIKRYVRLLRTDRWVNTAEAIIVSAEGVLNDGQHRLAAIVESGIPAPLDVRFGIERVAFTATGSGQRRTAGDALRVIDVEYPHVQASIARMLILHREGRLEGKNSVEPDELVQEVQGNPDIAVIASVIQNADFLPIRAAAVGFVLTIAAASSPMDRVRDFVQIAATGLTTAPNNPARTLHVRLGDARMRKQRLSPPTIATLTARAWNAWAEGRDLKTLQVRPGDETGRNFPEILRWRSPE